MSCYRCKAYIKIINCSSCNSVMHRGCITRYSGYTDLKTDITTITHCPACNKYDVNDVNPASEALCTPTSVDAPACAVISDADPSDYSAFIAEFRTLKQEIVNLKRELQDLKTSNFKNMEKLIADGNNSILQQIHSLFSKRNNDSAVSAINNRVDDSTSCGNTERTILESNSLNNSNVFINDINDHNDNKKDNCNYSSVVKKRRVKSSSIISDTDIDKTFNNRKNKLSINNVPLTTSITASQSRNIICGTSDNCKIKCAQKRTFYHINNCSPETTVNDVNSLLKEIGITASVVFALSKNPIYTSFKVGINESDVVNFLQPSNWPRSVTVREFVNRGQKPKTRKSALNHENFLENFQNLNSQVRQK